MCSVWCSLCCLFRSMLKGNLTGARSIMNQAAENLLQQLANIYWPHNIIAIFYIVLPTQRIAMPPMHGFRDWKHTANPATDVGEVRCRPVAVWERRAEHACLT